MKNIMYAVVAVMVIFLVVFTLITIQNKDVRSDETTNALEEIVDSTVKTVIADNSFTIADNDTFVASIIEGIASQIDSDADVVVNILDIDYEKKAVHLEVIEQYTNESGELSTASCETTVIYDETYDAGLDEDYVICYFFLTQDDLTTYLSDRENNTGLIYAKKKGHGEETTTLPTMTTDSFSFDDTTSIPTTWNVVDTDTLALTGTSYPVGATYTFDYPEDDRGSGNYTEVFFVAS